LKREKGVIVFDDAEEAKWFFHARLCKDSNDREAECLLKLFDVLKPEDWAKEFNWKFRGVEYKVKE